MLYQVLQNSKSYFRCVHHRLVPGKCLERHCHRSKMNSWYWQNKYIPDTGKDSGFWMSFVPRTHFYRQKTKYTKPAPNRNLGIWREREIDREREREKETERDKKREKEKEKKSKREEKESERERNRKRKRPAVRSPTRSGRQSTPPFEASALGPVMEVTAR